MPIYYGILGGDTPPTPSDEPIASIVGNVSRVGCWSLAFQPSTSQAVTLACDFSKTGIVEINIRELVELSKIDNARSIYIYNDSAFPINLEVKPLSQKAVFNPMTFGFVPVFASNKETITLTGEKDIGLMRVILTNVVMPITIDTIGSGA